MHTYYGHGRTLLLNATWEPLKVISTRRAVVLVLAEKAEVVHQSGQQMHSASLAIEIPSVIRLRYFVKVPYRARLRLTKKNIMARDEHRCVYCTKRADTIDHVLPTSRGGKHIWENVVAACQSCNSKKADKTLEELGWHLSHKPVAPMGTHWIIIGVAQPDPAWTPYLPAMAAAS